MRVRDAGAGLLALGLTLALATGAAAQDGQDPEMDRIAGGDRFQTAELLAYERFPDGAATAYLATSIEFADALAAGPVAARDGGPVLLVRWATVPEATERALRTLGVRRAVVLGGERAVSSAVDDALRALTGNPVRRIAGTTRFETAAAISERFEPGVDVAYVANGTNFPDALGGAAAGGATGGPVLLSTRDSLGRATVEALRRLRPGRVLVLGGTAAMSGAAVREIEQVTGAPVRRLSGPDRFATSAAISVETFAAGAQTAFLATGDNFPDALAAGPVAGLARSPLLLARRDCVPKVVLDELDRLAAERVVLVGGSAVLGAGPERLEPCGLEVVEVTRNLRVPWDVAFTNDGRTFVTERDRGRVVELTEDGPSVAHTFPDIDSSGEGGLLGLVASPQFADDGLLYAYMTTAQDNRVVQFRPGEPDSDRPIVAGIPRSPRGVHHGGRLVFHPHGGRLYIGTGDAGNPEAAQDPNSLAGKILRILPDGRPHPDNPSPDSRVFATGFHDVQGLAWVGLQLYATDSGRECDNEINAVVVGGNYGWPDGCGETRPDAVPPVIVGQPPEASWSGLGSMGGGLVSAWEGDLFAAALRGGRLWRFELDGGDVTATQELLIGEYGRLRHVAQAADGSLWVLTNNRDGPGDPRTGDDRILRIAPPGW